MSIFPSVTLLFTARDALESWHTQQQNRMGFRLRYDSPSLLYSFLFSPSFTKQAHLSPQHYDYTYSSPYSGTIRKDKEILREKLRLARYTNISLCKCRSITLQCM